MKYKVAIYSGSSPSTVFIENLIKSLSNSSIQVYIFGNESEKSPQKYFHVNYFLTPKNYFKKRYNFIKIISFALIFKTKYLPRYKVIQHFHKSFFLTCLVMGQISRLKSPHHRSPHRPSFSASFIRLLG